MLRVAAGGEGAKHQLHSLSHLLHQLNASLEIHAKVDEDPVDALLLVLFLLKYEHVMVEELLQFLVGEVDTQLFEAVELERDASDVLVSLPKHTSYLGQSTCIRLILVFLLALAARRTQTYSPFLIRTVTIMIGICMDIDVPNNLCHIMVIKAQTTLSTCASYPYAAMSVPRLRGLNCMRLVAPVAVHSTTSRCPVLSRTSL